MDIQKLKTALSSSKRKTIPEDLFIKRLRSLVIGEGMLDEGNIYLIDLAIKTMPENGNVIEIGSYGGLSTNLILHMLQKHNRKEKLFNCDPWIYEGYKDEAGSIPTTIDGSSDIYRSDYSRYMKQAFTQGVQFLHPDALPHTFNVESDDFFKLYETKALSLDLFEKEVLLGGPISFAYIDGNHSYEQTKRDFENVNLYLLNSGLILFDDSADGLPFGSAKFIQKMLEHAEFTLVGKNPNYLFKKKA